MGTNNLYRELQQVNTFDRIEKEGELTTNWLGPCIGSAIYSEKENIAYVGHFIFILDDGTSIRKYLDAVKNEFKSLEKLKVAVRGCHMWSDANEREQEYRSRQRTHFITMLKNADFLDEQLDIQWGADDYISKLSYNASERKIKLVTIPEDELSKQ